MTATLGLSLTTTVRVIDRVHGDTANGRPHAAPARRTGLPELAQAVLAIRDLAQGCTAIRKDATHFTGTQADRGVAALAGCKLHRGTGGTRQLRTLAGLHFNAVNN